MRRCGFFRYTWPASIFLLASGCLTGAQAQPDAAGPSPSLKESLRQLLQFDYDRATKPWVKDVEPNQFLQPEKDVKYYAAFVPLKEGDQTLYAIVYLYNVGRCGSGGCNTLILS